MGIEAWGQTVQQIKASATPGLWDFVSKIPTSFEAQILYGLITAGLIGLMANWLLKWSKGEVGSLRHYLFYSQYRRTILSVLTMLGTFLTAVTSGVFFTDAAAVSGEMAACVKDLPTPDKTFVGWINVLWVGGTTGFGIDAAVNKGEREVWTEEQRATKGQ